MALVFKKNANLGNRQKLSKLAKLTYVVIMRWTPDFLDLVKK
jgi:hypothetical protein